MAVAVNTMLYQIIDDLKYEMKYARKHADMTDQYCHGYVDALEYAAKEIVGKRLKEREKDDEQ